MQSAACTARKKTNSLNQALWIEKQLRHEKGHGNRAASSLKRLGWAGLK